MRAALDTLGNITVAAPGSAKSSRGRRIAVLGDMKELGEAGPRLHAGLAAAIVEADVDQVITVGELMSHLAKALPANQLLAQVATADEAARTLIANLMPNDVVMVKGSLSMAMVKVVNALLALDRGERRLAANG
jgi:UDP-N-acetylmuramoyl-tripeptide--D-alanyl-D-alanine ligase